MKLKIETTDSDFGSILICAVRYSLGRRSYMPSTVCGFIKPLVPHLSDRDLYVIAKDIEDAERLGYGYGDELIDKPVWMDLLWAILTEQTERKNGNKG